MRLCALITILCLPQIMESRDLYMGGRKTFPTRRSTQPTKSSMFSTTPTPTSYNFNDRSENLDADNEEFDSSKNGTDSVRENFKNRKIKNNSRILRVGGKLRQRGAPTTPHPTTPSDDPYLWPYPTVHKGIKDVCSRHHSLKVACFCFTDGKVTRKAECWMFGSDVGKDDETWKLFKQHNQIENFALIVQSSGFMDYMPKTLFSILTQIKELHISHASVDTIDSNTFEDLKHVETIRLTDNSIKRLEADSFSNLKHLNTLILENNEISEIHEYAFRNLPSLEHLSLANNQLTKLNDGFLEGLENLLVLDLTNNFISTLVGSIFTGLGKLKILQLQSNQIRVLNDQAFTELWSLIELNLDNNLIERISNRALDGLNNLQKLSLSHNCLRSLGEGIFRGTTALRYINLEHNNLEYLSNETFAPLMDNFKKEGSAILLAFNSLRCDCRIAWLYDLQHEPFSELFKRSLYMSHCVLANPKISDFKHPVPSEISKLMRKYGEMRYKMHDFSYDADEDYVADIHNNTPVSDYNGSRARLFLRAVRSLNHYNDPDSTEIAERTNATIYEAAGVEVPLLSIRRDSLLCARDLVLLTELPLSNMSGSENVFIAELTFLRLSMLVCFVVCLLVR